MLGIDHTYTVDESAGNIYTCFRRLGNTTKSRMLLDTGSTITLASEPFVQWIGVHRTHARFSIFGLAANNAGHTRGHSHFRLRSQHSHQII